MLRAPTLLALAAAALTLEAPPAPALAQAAPAPTEGAEPPACAAAIALMDAMVEGFDGRVVLSDEAAEDLRPPGGADDDWRKDEPSAGLAEQSRRAAPVNAVASCPSLIAQARTRGYGVGAKAVEAMVGSRERGRSGAEAGFILSIGLPVLSADGHEALAAAAMTCGSRCGAGVLYHLRQGKDGRWQVTDSVGLWIS